ALDVGYHSWHSHDLFQIYSTPGSWDLVYPSEWDVALPATPRQYFTLEPYPSSTLDQQDTAFQGIVATINAGSSGFPPKYFLYEGWPMTSQTGGNYQSFWTGGSASVGSTPYNAQLVNITYMYAQLQAVYGNSLYVIPIADALAALD